ncbi:hypothetical protein SK128_020103 [Halocaridina rubra]|uniref:F-box domain-containing protein n=1 Tax=Halocaridina rubra TaxID=373956 RepID=A0AAN9AGU6_HALRR
MAPRNYPDEIDVFTVPHSRMKELVNIYTQKVQCINFRDGREVVSLLHDLGTTLYEFKSHESIENIFIMDQLKNRLKQHQIHNSAVCDCHNDNRLADVLHLVRTGTKVREQGVVERLTFCQELQRAFDEFVTNFLTHMEEEEQVFQPLLVEYFEYDELKILKDIVLKEHEYVKERHCYEKAHDEEPETCDVVKDLRDLDWDLFCLSEESLEHDHCLPSQTDTRDIGVTVSEPPVDLPLSSTNKPSFPLPWEEYEAPTLPFEVLEEIFQYMSPQDLGRCAQVCNSWNNAAYSPSLWKAIFPVQWARGIWDWNDVCLVNILEDEAQNKRKSECHKVDEDKDVDEAEEQNHLAIKEQFVLEELVNWVLPRVGHGVKTLVVDAGLGITSRPLHHALILCPNIVYISAAYTHIDYYLFKGLWLTGALRHLQHLDLRGCEFIDDDALECLARCAAPNHPFLISEATHIPGDIHDNTLFYIDSSNEISLCEPVLSHDESILQHNYCTCYQTKSCFHRHSNTYSNNFCHSNIQSNPRSGKMTMTVNHPNSYFFDTNCSPRLNSLCENDKQALAPFSCDSNFDNSKMPLSLSQERDIEEICCRSGHFMSSENNIRSWDCFRRRNVCHSNGNLNNFERQHIPYECNPSSVGLVELKYLNLSGCWRITDEGLLAMVDAGVVNSIYHLDLSGCYQLTGEGLKAFVSYSRALNGRNLFYCDNIIDGPYPLQANGCNNLCNPVRVCCRNGR